MIVLDTNVVSELLRQRTHPDVGAWVERLPLHDPAVTAVSVFELEFGIALMAPSRKRDDLLTLVNRFPASLGTGGLFSLDAASASLASRFRAERQMSGRPVGVPDSPIAGIALRHGAALATRNIRDFEGAGLDLVDPWQASSP